MSERAKEIRRRRQRRQKVAHLASRLKNANPSEKAHIANKLRSLTPGAEVIIKNWGLEDQ